MKVKVFLVSIICFLLPLISHALACSAACDKKGACKRRFVIGSKKIDFYSNFPLNKKNNCIDQVIYVVHGTGRTAENYYFDVLNAAKSMNKQNNVLIISPLFKTSADDPDSNDYYWSSNGWKQGDNSINSGTHISSYTVADNILDNVITTNQFPALAHVTVTGHSAGGQYTQRYALTTANPEQHTLLPYQFIVMNPSSYAYLNNLRPNPTIEEFFELPITCSGSSCVMKPEYQAEAGNCPTTYDNYKYGLQNRNPYASQFSTTELIDQYIRRKVFYFLGALDTDPNDSDLDNACPGKLEGPYRLKRGQNFYSFLNQFFPTHQHILEVVPGVGHDASAMYNSDIVKTVLFN